MTSPHSCFRLLGLAAALALLPCGCGQRPRVSTPEPPDADPRVSFNTPYRNVRPEVKYVGDKACAGCHAEIAESYHHHPMGQSMAPAASLAERLDKAAGNPFERLGVQFLVERRGDHVFHKATRGESQKITDLDAEVQYVLGSGSHGKSYLIDRGGYLYQSPISWFTQKQTWDLSPGFENFYPQQRAVAVDCLFCHANRVELIEGSLNHYREPVFQGYRIGCERCHGPGELHVQSRMNGENAGDPDYTIVNPGRLEPTLRDAVCQQCHLQGQERVLRRGREPFDFRPGLPFHLFVSVFVRKPELQTHKAVGQFEQMYASRCYLGSNGELSCISCHNPHEKPLAGEVAAHYREACLQCHAESGARGHGPGAKEKGRGGGRQKTGGEMKGCALDVTERRKITAEDSCVVCHMPRSGSSDIVHTAITDHRILRKPEPENEKTPIPPLQPGEMPVINFHRQSVDTEDRDVARDLGITLTQLAQTAPQAQAQLGKLALPILEKAVETWPDDIPAREALGAALWAVGRGRDGLAVYEALLEKAPNREQAMLDAGVLAEHFNMDEKAIGIWKRALAVNPWNGNAHYRLSARLALREHWSEAIAECKKAIAITPALIEQRMLLIKCYLASGQKSSASREFAILESLKPPDLDVLQRWFAEQIR